MNYTEKYHLPQWEETDRVMRTDFNQMCARIENGLAQGQARDDALSGRIDSAQTAADTALAHKNYAIGTYEGTFGGQAIEVGFRPSALLIYNLSYRNKTYDDATGLLTLYVGPSPATVSFTDTGFYVPFQYGGECPAVNGERNTYIYIAFR